MTVKLRSKTELEKETAEKTDEELKRELQYSYMFRDFAEFDTGYYIKNIETYRADRWIAINIRDFIKNDHGTEYLYENERSCQLFGDDKYFKSGRNHGYAVTVLSRLGIKNYTQKGHINKKIKMLLRIKESYEQLPYFSYNRQTPQNILIVENKETYISIRNLIQSGRAILGTAVSTLIYNAGNRFIESFTEDIKNSGEPYMLDERNRFLYFGDIDYTGIDLYGRYADNRFCKLEPFLPAYRKLLTCADPPPCNAEQKRNIMAEELFFSYFTNEEKEHVLKILEEGKRIPQEFLNGTELVSEKGENNGRR